MLYYFIKVCIIINKNATYVISIHQRTGKHIKKEQTQIKIDRIKRFVAISEKHDR